MGETLRLVITRIQRGETEDGKAVIEMFEDNPRFKYPSLRLFDLSQLLLVGIDPNAMRKGDERIVRFHAYYTLSERLNKEGNPYKDVTHLEPLLDDATRAQATDMDRLFGLLERIVGHLAAIARGQNVDVLAPGPLQVAVKYTGLLDRPEGPTDRVYAEPGDAPKQAPKSASNDKPLNEEQSRRKFGRLAGPAIREGQIDRDLPGQLTTQVSAGAINWRAALEQLQAALVAKAD